MAENKKNTAKTAKTASKASIAPKAEEVIAKSATTETHETPAKTFTADEVQAMIKAAVEEATKSVHAQPMYVKSDEKVTLCYAGPMGEGTVFNMPDIGSINHQYGYLTVSKDVFLQKKDYKVDNKLKKRLLLVVSGLTDEERERYGVKYKPGEILSEKAFEGLLNLPVNELCEEFKRVCEPHKRIIATEITSAFYRGDVRATQEKVKAINDLSKGVDPEGLLTPVLEKIGENLAK